MFEDSDGNMRQFQLYDNISEFIQTFEENKRNKKRSKIKTLDDLGADLDDELTRN